MNHPKRPPNDAYTESNKGTSIQQWKFNSMHLPVTIKELSLCWSKLVEVGTTTDDASLERTCESPATANNDNITLKRYIPNKQYSLMHTGAREAS